MKFLQFLHVNSGPSDPGSFERHSFCDSAFLPMRFLKKMARVNEEHVEKRTSTWQWNHRISEHLIAKLREYKKRWTIKLSTLTRTSLLCTRSYESEWLNGFLTVLFNLRSLVAALFKSKKNGRWLAWSCCCWSVSMSIKNPSSCAQANNIGKTADNVKKKNW